MRIEKYHQQKRLGKKNVVSFGELKAAFNMCNGLYNYAYQDKLLCAHVYVNPHVYNYDKQSSIKVGTNEICFFLKYCVKNGLIHLSTAKKHVVFPKLPAKQITESMQVENVLNT